MMEGQIEQLKEQEKELQKTILKDKEILKSNKKETLDNFQSPYTA